jgi:pimeloyl-ACP methyl ester carboxylesterase
MEFLRIDRAHVTGHSYGGAIALQLALDAPESVSSLALLEPALSVGASAGCYRMALEGARTRYREAGGEVVLDEFLTARWPGYREPFDAAIPGGFDQGARDAGVFFECDLPGLLAWTFGEREVQRIQSSVLSMLGRNNDTAGSFFTEAHHYLLSRLPQVEGAIVNDGWHLFQVQYPAGTAAILADFWARHPIPDQ